MTHFLQDILRQPLEMQRVLELLTGSGRDALQRGATAMSQARHLYLTGMGSSWHAALNAGAICSRYGLAAHTLDISDLLESSTLPPHSVLLLISRSGRSVELVPLVQRAREASATVIGLTNNPDSPLALQCDIPMIVPVAPDHGISVNTYSTLALAAAALAMAATHRFTPATIRDLGLALEETNRRLPGWQEQVTGSSWPTPSRPYYFLARRSSFASAQEARLLWEEGVKAPATAMGTGSFRHGPQEIITAETHFCQWIDEESMRASDLAVARDLARLGAPLLLVGQNLPEDIATLTFQIPAISRDWQSLLDVIPLQLAAEHLSRLSGVDCDAFRYCSFIVEDDDGLLKADSTDRAVP